MYKLPLRKITLLHYLKILFMYLEGMMERKIITKSQFLIFKLKSGVFSKLKMRLVDEMVIQKL